jgi:hypothetical protein
MSCLLLLATVQKPLKRDLEYAGELMRPPGAASTDAHIQRKKSKSRRLFRLLCWRYRTSQRR